MLWAPMQLPETTIADQSLLKTGFRNASQVEVFSVGLSSEVFSEAFSMGVVELEVFVRLVPWVTIRVILLKIVLELVLDCPKNWPLWLESLKTEIGCG